VSRRAPQARVEGGERAGGGVHAGARHEGGAGGDSIVGFLAACGEVRAFQHVARGAEPVGLGGVTVVPPAQVGAEFSRREGIKSLAGHAAEGLGQDPPERDRLVGDRPAAVRGWLFPQRLEDGRPARPHLAPAAQLGDGDARTVVMTSRRVTSGATKSGSSASPGGHVDEAPLLAAPERCREHALGRGPHLKGRLWCDRDPRGLGSPPPARGADHQVQQPLVAAIDDELAARERASGLLAEKARLDVRTRHACEFVRTTSPLAVSRYKQRRETCDGGLSVGFQSDSPVLHRRRRDLCAGPGLHGRACPVGRWAQRRSAGGPSRSGRDRRGDQRGGSRPGD